MVLRTETTSGQMGGGFLSPRGTLLLQPTWLAPVCSMQLESLTSVPFRHTHTQADCAFRAQLELTSGPQGSEREDFQAEAASAEPPKQMERLRGATQGQGFHLVAVPPWAQTTPALQASVSLSVGWG